MPDFQYILNKLSIGLVILDRDCRVVSFNDIAGSVLGTENMAGTIGKTVQSIHPGPAKDKIQWLLDQAREEGSSGFVSMLVNVPDMVLQLRMVKLRDGKNSGGYCMLCYDITELTSRPKEEAAEPRKPRNLFKIPVYKEGRIALLDVDDVVYIQAEGHYARIHTIVDDFFCNLSFSQLGPRLPDDRFIRVHRSFIVNIQRAAGIRNQGDHFVILMDGTPEREVPVSRSNVLQLKQMLGV